MKDGRWAATLTVNKERHCKTFKEKEQAIKHRLYLEEKYGKTTGGGYGDLTGKTFGFYKVIGDTGKRKNGSVIYLARHTVTGEIREILRPLLTGGKATGYKDARTLTKKSSTGYLNVYYFKSANCWTSTTQDGKSLGYFKKFEDAVIAQQKSEGKNISEEKIQKNNFVIEKEKEIRNISIKKKIKRLVKEKESKGYTKQGNTWRASIKENGVSIRLNLKNEQQAINARQNYVNTVVEPQIQKLQEEINNDRI